MRHIAAESVGRVEFIARLAQERERVEVRPALAHAGGLRGAETHAAAHQPRAQSVRVFVQDDFRIEIAIRVRRRTVEEKHLNAAGHAVRSGSEVRVVEARAILRVRDDGVVPKTAATEVVLLIISRRLVEAEFVEPVVHPVAPIEELHRGGVAVGRRIVCEVKRRVEDAEGRALGAWEIRDVIAISIRVGIDVVAARFVFAITDPADGRGVRVQRAQRHERSRNERRLIGIGDLPARREWRRAVAGEDIVSGRREVNRQALADLQLARVRVQQCAITFAAKTPGDLDLPAQAQARFVHRQPGELRLCIARQAARFEHLTQFVAGGKRRERKNRLKVDRFTDGVRSELNRQRCRYQRVGLQRGAVNGANVGCGFRFGNELAGQAGQFAARRDVTDENALVNGDVVEPLFPDDSAQSVVPCHELALEPGFIENVGAVPEQCFVLRQEGFDDAMLIRRRNRPRASGSNGRSFTTRTSQKTARGRDMFRALPQRIVFDPQPVKLAGQFPGGSGLGGGKFPVGWLLLQTLVEVRQFLFVPRLIKREESWQKEDAESRHQENGWGPR